MAQGALAVTEAPDALAASVVVASVREAILARLVVVAAGITGVAAAARNVDDVPGHRRPAVLVKDGEERREQSEGRYLRAEVVFVELMPEIVIRAAAAPEDIGTLLDIYLARVLRAMTTDATISALVTKIQYEGCTVEPSTAENKEGRMEVNLVFTYTLKMSDLAGI